MRQERYMPGPNDDRPDGAPSHIHIEKKKPNWLAWLLLGLGILALLLALSRCHKDQPVALAPAAAPAPAGPAVVGATADAGKSTALMGTSGLGSYLSGSEVTPRTFVFEKLNFDTDKSDIRAADAAEINAVAATLAKYPTTHIRIAGYADATGNDATNMALGKARADSVKAALVGKGIDASRVDTVSGGSTDPVDTNATPDGRFKNRRTEVVVTSR
jgi:outer membrane protein OmpA-like peptidoglycan-associated protein